MFAIRVACGHKRTCAHEDEAYAQSQVQHNTFINCVDSRYTANFFDLALHLSLVASPLVSLGVLLQINHIGLRLIVDVTNNRRGGDGAGTACMNVALIVSCNKQNKRVM